MPFWAMVEALTGEVLEVVESLDEAPAPGVIAVELPAREDDMRAWVAAHRRKKAGASARELLLEKEEFADDAHRGGRRDEMRDAEQFFARLEQELLRAELERRQFSVLLFDLHPLDRSLAQDFVAETLKAQGQEILPCDLVARLRDHLVGVVMPDIDAREMRVEPPRGHVTLLLYPRDHEALEALRRRRHPLLRSSVLRG
ncbi:MAG TPA: hypothetical protein VEZ14_06995 [Dehalococcoidia bacterium]|nr:hypothetical protein [Dehalococcoidia bacterium]